MSVFIHGFGHVDREPTLDGIPPAAWAYKEKVIDLLMRVETVSVETVRIVEAMKLAPR